MMTQLDANDAFAIAETLGETFELARGSTVEAAVDALVAAGGRALLRSETAGDVAVVQSVTGRVVGVRGNRLGLAPVACYLSLR